MQLRIPQKLNSTKFVERRSILFLLCFLALSAIALSTWQSISYFIGKKERAVLVQNAINNGLANLQQRAAGKLAGSAASLHVLARSPTLQQYVAGTGRISDELITQTFTSLIESNSNVYQIRFLDAVGMEKIRINKNDGTLRAVPGSELQDKANRDYFIEVRDAGPGEMYVSALDLNVENGRVEIPWRPTIRVATPVFNSAQQFTGVLIINLDVSDIIEIYRATDTATQVNVMLVNDSGYWFYGRGRELLWGFMFDKSQNTLTEMFPQVWEKIVAGDASNFSMGADDWTFKSTTVADLFPNALTYSHADRILWHAIVKNPPQTFFAAITGYIPSLVILIALMAFSWAWASNVSERRRAEKELVKSEKLSSLGGLVAGVAHELNTPIGSAVTIASTMQEKADTLYQSIEQGQVNKSHIVEFVDSIRHGSGVVLRGLNRAVELIGHFKQIAVDQSGERRRTFVLDEYIEEMSATFNHLFRHRQVQLLLNLHSGVSLDSYPGPLSQVIINLVQNSIVHGFDENEPGTINITTHLLSAGQVQLEVYDNGRGIPDNIIDHVFEPFFTTKLGQGGSGLGLHIVYNIVTDMLGGELRVESNERKRFTRFTIVLPLRLSKPLKAVTEETDHAQRNAA